MDESQSMEEVQEARTHPDNISRRVDSVIVITEERGGFQLPPTVRHPFSGPPSDGVDGVEPSSPTVSGISFRNNIQ